MGNFGKKWLINILIISPVLILFKYFPDKFSTPMSLLALFAASSIAYVVGKVVTREKENVKIKS